MTITVTGGPAYGLAWNKTADTYTRVASAAGLTAGANFDSPSGGAWGLRRCNLWGDGTPTAYYGDRCYTDTDVANMGQAMVQIPKFYYYMEYDAGTTTYYWFVTTVAATTVDVGLGVGAQAVKLHPAFSRNSVTKNYIYLGAYEGYYNATTTKLESTAGYIPTASKTLAQFRTAAAGIGTGWGVQDYLSTSAIQLLELIEYASFDSKNVNGGGGGISPGGGVGGIVNLQAETNRVTGCLTGHTGSTGTNLGNASGYTVFTTDAANGLVAPDAATSTNAISYRGVENPWGNLTTLIDGIKIVGLDVWVADHGFDSSFAPAAPYVDTSLTVLTGADYITDIAASATYDYGFLPKTGGGAYYTYLCNSSLGTTGNQLCGVGGAWNGWITAGLWYFEYEYGDISDIHYGSRLMYVG